MNRRGMPSRAYCRMETSKEHFMRLIRLCASGLIPGANPWEGSESWGDRVGRPREIIWIYD